MWLLEHNSYHQLLKLLAVLTVLTCLFVSLLCFKNWYAMAFTLKKIESQRVVRCEDPKSSAKTRVTANEVISKPYCLNIQRSLAKKLKAASRKCVEYVHTDGGLTGQADAMTFELMKEPMLVYYAEEGVKHFKANITESKDRKGNCVQKTIKVVYLNQIDSYTVNLYYTRCSFLINGKSVNKFIQKDLKGIIT